MLPYWNSEMADSWDQQYGYPQHAPEASSGSLPYIEDDAQRFLYEKIQEAEVRAAAADSRLIQLRQFQAKEVAFQWKARAQISDYAQTVDWKLMEAMAAADVAEQRCEAQAEAANQWRELAEQLDSRLRALENENHRRSRLEAWEAKEGKRMRGRQQDAQDPPSKWMVKADQPQERGRQVPSKWVEKEDQQEEPESSEATNAGQIKVDTEDVAAPSQSSPNSISREQLLKMQWATQSAADDKQASVDSPLKTLSTNQLESKMETAPSIQGKNRVKELQGQVETLQQEVKALKSQLKRQKDEAVIAEQLKSELTKLRAEKKTVDKEKAQLETRVMRIEEENKIMKRRLKHFERELSTSVGSAGFSTEVDSDEEVSKKDDKIVEEVGNNREDKDEGAKVSAEERGRSPWFFW